jgi:hypothetical protein
MTELAFPLAHAGHVLLDLAVFLVPVGMVALTILVLNLRDRD